MKYFRALAVGGVAAVLAVGTALAQYSGPTPTLIVEPRSISPSAAIEAISKTNSAVEAHAIYTGAVNKHRKNIQLHDRFMRRMLELKRPEMAYSAASALTVLQPANSTMKPIYCRNVRVLGVVTGVVRRL